MSQGSVVGPLLFLLYTPELFPFLENMLIGYAYGSTLSSIVPSPGVRITVTESLNMTSARLESGVNFWDEIECK